MKKLCFCLFLIMSVQLSFAAFPIDSTQALLPQQQNVLSPLSHMTVKEYEQQTGKTLSLTQKLSYRLMQHHLKKYSGGEKDNTATAVGGFLLGFFLLPIGVLIAYLLPKNKTLRKWSLIGFGSAVAVYLLAILLLIIALRN